MKTASKYVYDLLSAAASQLALGAPLSTDEWALYRDVMPDTPVRVVSIFSTPSGPADVPLDPMDAYVESLYVQIRARGRCRDEAEEKATAIRDFLLRANHSLVEQEATRTTTWQAVRSQGGSFESKDSKELSVAIVNLQVVRSVEGVRT